MSKYFREPSRIKLSLTVNDVNAMTDEDLKKIEAECEARCMTHEDRLRFVENIERNNGGHISWDMSCSFDEYARRVCAGEDVDDE